MAFSIYEVVRVACQSRRRFVFSWGVYNKPTTRLTSDTNDFVNSLLIVITVLNKAQTYFENSPVTIYVRIVNS